MSNPRKLSQEFMKSLMEGMLVDILARVKKDHTLDLQIRQDEVHIYYRGGNILGLNRIASGFETSFEKKYVREEQALVRIEALPRCISVKEEAQQWVDCFSLLKQSMDFHFSRSQKNEREFQQLFIRENNYSNLANGTDYFMVDCEYIHPNSTVNGRADLVGLKWKSEGSARKKGEVGLAMIEVKFGDAALCGTSGLYEHVKHMHALIEDLPSLSVTKEEMLEIFEQKRRLGLVSGIENNPNQVKEFVGPVEILLLLINHDPASSVLNSELERIDLEMPGVVKMACANFLGYGLYEDCVYKYPDFRRLYARQIYNKKN